MPVLPDRVRISEKKIEKGAEVLNFSPTYSSYKFLNNDITLTSFLQ